MVLVLLILHIARQVTAYGVGVAGWGAGLKLGSDSVCIKYTTHHNNGITLFDREPFRYNNQLIPFAYFKLFITTCLLLSARSNLKHPLEECLSFLY